MDQFKHQSVLMLVFASHSLYSQCMETPEMTPDFIDNLILNQLRLQYENVCFQSQFITRVLEVKARTAIQILNDAKDQGIMYQCDCQVIVESILIPPLTHLFAQVKQYDANHQNLDKSNFLMKRDDIWLGVTGRSNSQIQDEQMVPCTVSESKYTSGTNQIRVLGTIYQPSNFTRVYRITCITPGVSKRPLEYLMDQVKQKRKQLMELGDEQKKQAFKLLTNSDMEIEANQYELDGLMEEIKEPVYIQMTASQFTTGHYSILKKGTQLFTQGTDVEQFYSILQQTSHWQTFVIDCIKNYSSTQSLLNQAQVIQQI